MQSKAAFKYILLLTPLLVWWGVVFFPSSSPVQKSVGSPPFVPKPTPIPLSNWSRTDLHQALLGDIDQMMQLIQMWQVDAFLLKEANIPSSQCLSPAEYLHAQALYRRIRDNSPRPLPTKIFDDRGRPLLLSAYKKLLPQTYLAASILLALVSPERIAALPKGFRERERLFPTHKTASIDLEIDRNRSEALFLQQPEVAFVADYSLPSTLNALAHQGIHLFFLSSTKTLQEIQSSIVRIAQIAGEQEKGELLALFIQAALGAIDNTLLMQLEGRTFSVLYTTYSTQFSFPTRKTLTRTLLTRLENQSISLVTPLETDTAAWSIPLNQEQLHQLDPDCLIVATSNANGILHMIDRHPQMSQMRCVSSRRVIPVDVDIQYSPTQFMALAYFDLALAILQGSRS